ncbi:DBP [unidentified adenovirus]|uniref:DBP n=1 Tax=Chinstrap penguin adenovirus 2 TaxID=1434088 RepID=A0A162HSK4_9ADEN|nr:DBP [Chinstrap penguin adenovirus 2]ALB78148.1 DBP [Chinstrap penguin adenovirus 2]ALB78170.1 DBP [unidentified adenovirus]ALB78192.1 DBP [unidentified adenovirus]ALB78214.1 DBP [unidentified adenovirus]
MSSEKRPAEGKIFFIEAEAEPANKKQHVDDEIEVCHQKAMQYAAGLCALYGCQTDVNILPTSDFWAKLVETYVKKSKPDLNLTISSAKSFYHFCGRILASFIYNETGLECHFNCLGANIWIHNWKEDSIRCFHGTMMISKPITYNLSPQSDEGIRAITSGEGKIEKGKNQKDVIKLTNYSNIVCAEDINIQWPVVHSAESCGMNFGNKDKAKAAYLHNISWTSAMFPKANKTEIAEKMIIVTKCFCNYGHDNIQLGRQCCKMTAFEIPGAGDIDPDSCTDQMMLCTYQHRQTFVFQCCNPMNYKKTTKEKEAQKHCDFKLSMIDLRQAMKISKDIWSKLKETLGDGSPTKINLPIFMFNPKKHCFKQAIVAQHEVESDEDAFS